MRVRSAFHFRSLFSVIRHPEDDGMSNRIRDDLQNCVRLPALPILPGETVAAQMRRSWERLGRPKWWRFKAAWYGEGGCFSGAAAQDLQERYLQWREAEAARASAAEAVERARQRASDRALLESTLARHLAEVAKIQARLSVLGEVDHP